MEQLEQLYAILVQLIPKFGVDVPILTVAILILILILILASFFPISAGLYLATRRQRELRELKEDFELLGLKSAALAEHDNQPFTYRLEFAFQSLLPAAISGVAVLLLLLMAATQADNSTLVLNALGYGFLGAYIFSIQLIYRRYTTLDLQPSVYMNCTLTLIAGLAFNYTAFAVVSSISKTDPQGIGAGLVAIIAFSLGYFPLLAIRWFNRLTTAALGNDGYKIDSLPLSVIDGISQFHETRLRDEGVDNVQNLASVKIDQLLVSTRFGGQQVLEWIDQAILLSYIDPGNIESFRRAGVRKVSDFLELWEPYHFDPTDEENGRQRTPEMEARLAEERRNRALQLQSTPEYLDTLYIGVRTGPNSAYIAKYWTNLKEAAEQRQAIALEKEQKEVQDVITKTQRHIFRRIGRCDLHDATRETLGTIADEVTENHDELADPDESFAEDTDLLIGLAWWLWWLSGGEEEDDYTDAAGHYYERALENRADDADLLYEVSAFYADINDYERAREAGSQAVPLFREAGQTRRALLAEIMTAMVYMKAGQQENGIALIKEVTKTLEVTEVDVGSETGLMELQSYSATIVEFFDEEPVPEEIAALQSRLASLISTGSGDG